ncbi:structural maintenance of chromosomes protein 2 isoform X2 [Aethina tumida]|uniref:structural maintenance of chromosomes protein 2 isoform X2 n=1 Tax=Aethina tumida TaxID=116153 RepID=UPI00096B4156|nr:structural maintenance of chromosomes protein 2 isoform X2 [Aethina tumida]
MYIKSIILEGFKSYGHRTEISGFDPSFNAITGLNGSGKSNILDAICFLLGITNLAHVRAHSLQELIFKSGQAGIHKATVSIAFDNTNPAQCPPGFEDFNEIVVTRQIVMGGKNKYMINGTNVPNKKVQDLFCAVQLNVNNPHFLIMQGKVTKVLNMKPPEILGMVEEAAGTRMFEIKRQAAIRLIEKKDAKLLELDNILKEEVSPKLEKLREERSQYLEYKRVERELEHMLALFIIWKYFSTKRAGIKVNENLSIENEKKEEIERLIIENEAAIRAIEQAVAEYHASGKNEISDKLKQLNTEYDSQTKMFTKSEVTVKDILNNIKMEKNKIKQLEKSIQQDSNSLEVKQQEKDNLQSRKFEALSSGMEINDAGEAETLQEQLINAKQAAAQASTESKQAQMQLTFCQNEVAKKEKVLSSTTQDHNNDQVVLQQMQKEVEALEQQKSKINFDPSKMQQLSDNRRMLHQKCKQLKDRVENFEDQYPHTRFNYSLPDRNFNKDLVSGVVCNLFRCRESIHTTALETVAGGRLFNVVVNDDQTSRALLQRGQLKSRTTFIPLNKIQGKKMNHRIVELAQDLVGRENCQPAISLIDYDPYLQPAMEYVFGNVFVCKDINVAKRITFDPRIRKRCVTLDGDITDPSGTLSGGARRRGGSLLLLLKEIQECERELFEREQELNTVETNYRYMAKFEEQFMSVKNVLELRLHEVNLLEERVMNSTYHRQQQEYENLKKQIDELKIKTKECKEAEEIANKKAKELEAKMKDSTGCRDRMLKEAEAEMKALKTKAEISSNKWKQREVDYETLNLDIGELEKSVESSKEQIQITEENIKTLTQKHEEEIENFNKIKETMKELKNELEKGAKILAEQNKQMQHKVKQKEKLAAKAQEMKLEAKKYEIEITKLEKEKVMLTEKQHELSKQIKDNSRFRKEAEGMSDHEGRELERRIKHAQERKQKLMRTINAKAQALFDHEEKKYNDLKRKYSIVETDKKKLLTVLKDLDEKKKQSLRLAHEQVSRDFGSIFSILLPGANAKLVAPQGKTILQGMEIKVSLGDVWKESLTELSGGQRSLAALSLILAMLLFKPAPLYILDEVDAALDLSHTQNIGKMLKSHFNKSQFIIVSLKDGMFNNANVLFRTRFMEGVSSISRTANKTIK